jgi:hypothetical protein
MIFPYVHDVREVIFLQRNQVYFDVKKVNADAQGRCPRLDKKHKPR